ncbi:O-acetylserine/cysteine exporter [Marinobacter confluentis]|uniref:O-acetylserine/cysteine exporter n=1 Tax=Marinobacter confluentis TaxID=1697557 RepID=A0A4Z1C0V6_9GAMM|nr:O-acetylserine/cysteine exporter [Marinobacter confluentis]
MNHRDTALALVVVSVWGANFTVIKLGLDGVPPMLLVAMRYALAALPAVFFLRLPIVRVRYLFWYGIAVGVGQFGCLFYAMHIGMPAGLASVLLQSQVFFTLIFAAITLRERVSGAQLAGLWLAVSGLLLIGYRSVGTGLVPIPLPAFLFTLAGAASWGLSNIIVRKASAEAAQKGDRLDMFSFVVWSSLVPPIPLFLFASVLNPQESMVEVVTNLDGISVFAIAYLAFAATLFGFGVWSSLLSRYPASQVAPLSLLVPVTGLLTASVALSEELSMSQWIGSFLILCGLAVSTFGFPKVLSYGPTK